MSFAGLIPVRRNIRLAKHCPVKPKTKSLILATLLALTGCSQDTPMNTPATEPSPVPVRATVVSNLAEQDTLYFATTVRNRQRALVPFQVAGVIRQRHVEIGDRVVQGQMLAELHNPQLVPARDAARARVQQLTTDLDQAQRDLVRLQQLLERSVVAPQEVETQQARTDNLSQALNDARATLRQAENFLDESVLRAPFAGTVNAILMEPGEFVQAGQAVLQLSDPAVMEAEVRVPAQWLTGLRAGDRLRVVDRTRNHLVEGLVRDIGTSSDNTLYPLILSFDTEDLKSGDAVEVGLQRGQLQGLTIPLTAVMRTAEGLAVFRIITIDALHHRVQRIPVSVQRMYGESVVISADCNTGNGLQAGDLVVYAGLTRLTDGDHVELIP